MADRKEPTVGVVVPLHGAPSLPSTKFAGRAAPDLRVLLDEAVLKARMSEGRVKLLEEALRDALDRWTADISGWMCRESRERIAELRLLLEGKPHG